MRELWVVKYLLSNMKQEQIIYQEALHRVTELQIWKMSSGISKKKIICFSRYNNSFLQILIPR